MTWFTLNCPWCGVELRSTNVFVGLLLGCPNIEGGCGRPSKVHPGMTIPLEMRVVRVT